MEQKHVKIGELEIPQSYFDMDEEGKEQVCLTIMDAMLTLLDKNLNSNINRMYVLDRLLESTIITNEMNENYEICDVLLKIRELINE